MKKLLLILAILLVAVHVQAAPFLVVDTPPAEWNVIGVRGTMDGQAFEQLYKLHPDGTALTVYDIGTLNQLKHTFTNIRFYNSRGEGPSVPFDLPATLGAPSNTRLKP